MPTENEINSVPAALVTQLATHSKMLPLNDAPWVPISINTNQTVEKKRVRITPSNDGIYLDEEIKTGIGLYDFKSYPVTKKRATKKIVAAPNNVVPIIDEIGPTSIVPTYNGPSLKSVAISEGEFVEAEWPTDKITHFLGEESWRGRDIGERAEIGDIMCFLNPDGGIDHYEKVVGWKNMELTEELLDNHGVSVLTIQGTDKKRKITVIHETIEFSNIFEVPKGTKCRLPSEKSEAIRFFMLSENEILPTEVMEKGVTRKCFCPDMPKMSNKKFRCAFSRIFSDYARRHLRGAVRESIPGRGMGTPIQRGKRTKLTIKELLKQDPILPPFLERIKRRALTPIDFRYDRAIGVEIEAICPISHADSQAKVPHFVRVDMDGSLRDAQGRECRAGEHGVWGSEFRILIPRVELESRLQKALDAINKLGVVVNKTCGLHVHFDNRYRHQDYVDSSFRPLSEAERREQQEENEHKHYNLVEKRVERLRRWLKVLVELVPESRRDNKYCKLEAADNSHHEAVSISSFKKHGTIEVRLHSATTDFIKIVNWIRLIEILFTLKHNPLPNLSTLDALKALPLTDPDRQYWYKRHQQLNPNLYKKGPKLDTGFLGKPEEIE